MFIRESWRDPVLINTIGHSAGALLFCVIIVLLIRAWRSHEMRRTSLSLVAAGLALGWNIGSLVVLALPESGSPLINSVVTVSFSMLSMLPAVLLHVAVQGQLRKVVAAGYTVSGCAAALHFSELVSPYGGLHQAALLVVAVGFGVIAAGAFLIERRNEEHAATDRSKDFSLACLLLFTTSFLHFGYEHTGSAWSGEVTWHHLGIPVALIVLLRDYRFLLLDTFLRFAVNFGIAAMYVAGVIVLSLKFHLTNVVFSSKFLSGISLVLVCLSLIVFAHLRNALQARMNRVIFRRRSIEGSIKKIQTLSAATRSEEELLSRAAQEVANYLRTNHFAITKATVEPPGSGATVLFGAANDGGTRERGFYPEARIALRLSSGDVRYLEVGNRLGGRRYWNDDLDDMRQLGAAIVEQLERFRAEELKRLVSQAELRALQAQINPHFLFNALNTLYGTIDRGSPDARRMVLNLAEIFRYFLQGHRTVIPLAEELKIVEAYLEIEAVRLGDRLTMELIVSESARARLIPILCIQPLVENAVKHGVALKQERCRVSVRAETVSEGLRVSVEDTGAGFEQSRKRGAPGARLGLDNVRRRLLLSYGPAADLKIQSSAAGTTVSFLIPNSSSTEPAPAETAVPAWSAHPPSVPA